MPKNPRKRVIVVPEITPTEPEDNIILSPQDLLAMTRHEHASQMAQLNLKLAQAHARAVRLEIEQSARAASEGQTRCQSEFDACLEQQKSFANSLAQRYAFDWKTHAYDTDTGIVRRCLED